MVELVDGTEIELIPVQSRVRHKKNGLVGTIMSHEYAAPGKLSAIPYKVYWDDDAQAVRLMGWMYLYPCYEFLEVLPEGA